MYLLLLCCNRDKISYPPLSAFIIIINYSCHTVHMSFVMSNSVEMFIGLYIYNVNFLYLHILILFCSFFLFILFSLQYNCLSFLFFPYSQIHYLVFTYCRPTLFGLSIYPRVQHVVRLL